MFQLVVLGWWDAAMADWLSLWGYNNKEKKE